MKVAFIVGSFPTLSETFILNQITGLLDLGHQVDIYASRNLGERKVHPDIAKYRLMERVRYFDIPTNKPKRVLKAAWLIESNFYKSPLAMLNALNVFKFGKKALSPRTFYYLVPFLGREQDYDIIHCHFGPRGIVGVFLKDLGIGGKVVTTFHAHDINKFVRERGKNVYSYLFKRGDAFLPISNYCAKELIKLGCEKEKMTIHRMGIDLQKFRYSPKKAAKGESVKILTVGRLVECKGHEYAIRALAEVIRKHKNVKYVIAGDGPLRSYLENLVKDLNLKENVNFLGEVDQDEVTKLYRESHLFVLPSVTAADGNQEGVPVVLMEAQASGLPVVSTLFTGVPEVVADGKSGFLVSERDVSALAEKLEYLIDHPDLWPKMGRAGSNLVEENYNIKKLNLKLVKIFEDLL
ncbi:colanic acid biosynthesis glycosyltransferase WcaL [Candidatus Woesebacteria bacterium RBG_19FT_COMBO_42_9]|nr:MAG: colanic acid biosynthesis glycosyltransferase WcaL [Candidatus Woesebacteria bacterium RBG_19FT_COMBO_42_9]